MPLVSAVIPTRNRPQLVYRAIVSVLAQTFQDFEIIVVVDGPDPATVASLTSVGDPRLRWFVCEESVGGAEARNVGIRMAAAPWVALLDDDDEWLPSKLEDQLAEARTARPNCLIVTRFLDKRPNADIVQPGLPPRPGQPISEYMFCETSALGFRNGFLQTSTWLAPTKAMLEVPFTKGLPRNQETDWLLRAVPALNLEVRVAWKILALFHNESSTGRITSKSDWRDTLNWAVNGNLFTPKALFYFMATVSLPAARLSGAPVSVFWDQLKIAMRKGQPTPRSLWLFFAGWFIFPYGRFGLRSRLQNVLNRRTRALPSPNS